jgi:transposase-like protein
MPDPTFPPEGRHYSTFSCPNLRCPSRGPRETSPIAHRSWTGKNKHIERLRCKACGQEFSERRGTLMEGTKLPEETVERLLKCQRWGVCDAGTADICGVDIKTVHRFQHVAAQRAQAHHEQVTRELRVEAVQLDEMHSKRRGPHVDWLHTALAMRSRFVLWVHWGPRTQESAAVLMAQVVKVRDGTGKLLRVVTRVVYGGPRRFVQEMASRGLRPSIQTAFMERWYGTLRGLCAPLRRRTRCSSASPRRHRARVWLVVDLYNFVLPHKSLRQGGRPRTPAMAIGVAGHVWSYQDYLWCPVHPDPLDRQRMQQRVKELLVPALEAG